MNVQGKKILRRGVGVILCSLGGQTKILKHDPGLPRKGEFPTLSLPPNTKMPNTFGGLHICNSRLNLYHKILACNHEEVHKCWVFLRNKNSSAIYLCNLFFIYETFKNLNYFPLMMVQGPCCTIVMDAQARPIILPGWPVCVLTQSLLTWLPLVRSVSGQGSPAPPNWKAGGNPWSCFSEVSAYTKAAVTRSILLWCCQEGGGSVAHHSPRWLVTPSIILPLCQVCLAHYKCRLHEASTTAILIVQMRELRPQMVQ